MEGYGRERENESWEVTMEQHGTLWKDMREEE